MSNESGSLFGLFRLSGSFVLNQTSQMNQINQKVVHV